jgi:hypothetical protein
LFVPKISLGLYCFVPKNYTANYIVLFLQFFLTELISRRAVQRGGPGRGSPEKFCKTEEVIFLQQYILASLIDLGSTGCFFSFDLS